MIQLNNEQQKALDAMMSGRNVFLTGEAGTGKSTVLREFLERCDRPCAVLAPTGVAAINVGGTTIHSFFMLKPGLLSEDTIDEIGSGKKRAAIRAAKTIVIDEISMTRSDLFAAIDIRLRSLARGGNRERPFGGKQMIFVGDFFQLPPVVKTETETEFLKREFGGEYAFETELWEQTDLRCVFLKTIHRQKNDARFLRELNTKAKTGIRPFWNKTVAKLAGKAGWDWKLSTETLPPAIFSALWKRGITLKNPVRFERFSEYTDYLDDTFDAGGRAAILVWGWNGFMHWMGIDRVSRGRFRLMNPDNDGYCPLRKTLKFYADKSGADQFLVFGFVRR